MKTTIIREGETLGMLSARLGVPVKFIGVGETADDLLEFDAGQFVQAFFE